MSSNIAIITFMFRRKKTRRAETINRLAKSFFKLVPAVIVNGYFFLFLTADQT